MDALASGVVRDRARRRVLARLALPWLMSGLTSGLAGLRPLPAAAQDPGGAQGGEYPLKAAFLYKFLNFVEWPASAFERPDSPLLIGVMNADALAEAFARIAAERSSQGHPLTVRKLRAGESAAGLHVLFIGRSAAAQLAAILAAARSQPLLTVSESSDAFELGSVVDFVVEDGKIRFDVSQRAAERAQLKISSRLLTLARRVVAGGVS